MEVDTLCAVDGGVCGCGWNYERTVEEVYPFCIRRLYGSPPMVGGP